MSNNLESHEERLQNFLSKKEGQIDVDKMWNALERHVPSPKKKKNFIVPMLFMALMTSLAFNGWQFAKTKALTSNKYSLMSAISALESKLIHCKDGVVYNTNALADNKMASLHNEDIASNLDPSEKAEHSLENKTKISPIRINTDNTFIQISKHDSGQSIFESKDNPVVKYQLPYITSLPLITAKGLTHHNEEIPKDYYIDNTITTKQPINVNTFEFYGAGHFGKNAASYTSGPLNEDMKLAKGNDNLGFSLGIQKNISPSTSIGIGLLYDMAVSKLEYNILTQEKLTFDEVNQVYIDANNNVVNSVGQLGGYKAITRKGSAYSIEKKLMLNPTIEYALFKKSKFLIGINGGLGINLYATSKGAFLHYSVLERYDSKAHFFQLAYHFGLKTSYSFSKRNSIFLGVNIMNQNSKIISSNYAINKSLNTIYLNLGSSTSF